MDKQEGFDFESAGAEQECFDPENVIDAYEDEYQGSEYEGTVPSVQEYSIGDRIDISDDVALGKYVSEYRAAQAGYREACYMMRHANDEVWDHVRECYKDLDDYALALHGDDEIIIMKHKSSH